jgi:hypothetical protein
MSRQQTLQKEIAESKRWLDIERNDSTYKRELKKRIELINWVLENMKNPDISICDTIKSKMNEIVLAIFDDDKFNSELRILD